jgi:hypothetical protein
LCENLDPFWSKVAHDIIRKIHIVCAYTALESLIESVMTCPKRHRLVEQDAADGYTNTNLT